MFSKKFNLSFTALGLLIGLTVSIFIINSGCHQLGPDNVILDSAGNVVYVPDGKPGGMVQIPDIGSATGNYALASIAAAFYGALGYWVRRVKKNGTAATAGISKRLDQVERKTASIPEPAPPTTTQVSMADLVDLLHQLNTSKSGPPPTDGTSQ